MRKRFSSWWLTLNASDILQALATVIQIEGTPNLNPSRTMTKNMDIFTGRGPESHAQTSQEQGALSPDPLITARAQAALASYPTTSAFGVVFVDVEDNTSTEFTLLEFFDASDSLIFSRHALSTGNQGLSFLGGAANAGELISHVRITTPDNFLLSNGVRANENHDFVVMDDFIYAAPQPLPLPVSVPEPATWALLLLAVAALRRKAR